MIKLAVLLALVAIPSLGQGVNWTGPYKPCLNSAELKTTGHMRIGVRYDISNPHVIEQFHRAFDFWAQVLDADFYDEQSASCAIAIVDGTPALLKSRDTVARAQVPEKTKFYGWIAVDPRASSYLSNDDAIANWMHEIGHLLGLKHNPSADSLMYFLDCDARSKLDSYDLRALALLHSLRPMYRLADSEFLLSGVSPE